jgi:DNA-binding beta-propeller fold protein YncE
LGNSSLIAADVRTGNIAFNVSLGYWPNSVVVDSLTDVVFATGCADQGLVCNSVVSAVNATSGTLLNRITLGNDAYPRLTVNPVTNVAYVSGSAQLVALNGTTGKIVFDVNSMACGVLDSMTTDTSSNQVLAMTLDYNYILAYDGTTGALLNMYSLPSSPNYVAYDSGTNEVYVTTASGQLLAFPNVFSSSHVNIGLIGAGQNCLPP